MRGLSPAAAAMLVTLATAVVASAAPTTTQRPSEAAKPPESGSAARSLDAERIRGPDPTDLGRLHGRVVLLDFWATWCGPCKRIMPRLDTLHERHHDEGLTVLGISAEPRRVIEAHLRQMEPPVHYTIARDSGATQRRYGVTELPMLVLIDRGGKVRAVFEDGARDLAALAKRVRTLLDESKPPSAR